VFDCGIGACIVFILDLVIGNARVLL